MVAFGHTAVGVLVGVGIYQNFGNTNPELGLLFAGGAGVISHYIADFVPHGHFFGNKDFKDKILIDIIFDLFLSLALFSGLTLLLDGLGWKFWYIILGMAGSQLPDVLAGLYVLKILPHRGIFKIEHGFHESTHWHGIFKNGKLIDGLPLGLRDIWQVIVILVAFLAVLTF